MRSAISEDSAPRSLRPVDLARDVGLSVTQIRTYERLGVLPPAERSRSGRRVYDARHLQALRAARAAMAGYGWEMAVEILAAVHRGELARARSLVDEAHGALAMLRATGYRFPLIAQILGELAAGNPEQAQRALEHRLIHLDEASANCLAASPRSTTTCVPMRHPPGPRVTASTL
jgi:DNA-binding transcriptional MerR regulator